MRLAVVLSHPTQYYSPWFRWLAQNTQLQLRVFYLWDAGLKARKDPHFGVTIKWDTDLLSGYDSVFLPNRSPAPHTDTFFGLLNPSAPAALAEWEPDAILLFGYRFATHLMLIAWARLNRIPLLFRGDSHLLGRPHPSLPARLALSFLYRQFSAFACVGQANRAYFRCFGVPKRRLFLAPHSVDQDHFQDPQGKYAAQAADIRKSLGIPDSHRIILFAGKLHGGKNPAGLLEAFIALAPRDWSLIFVGDGADAPLLHTRAAAFPSLSVHFLPFANQGEMPARYQLATLFCLPSLGLYETWGLAINEAMHLGKPCLVSDLVGCQKDLVSDGITGWVFPSARPLSLADKLQEAMNAPWPLFSEKARERASLFSYAAAAKGLLQALDFCTREKASSHV